MSDCSERILKYAVVFRHFLPFSLVNTHALESVFRSCGFMRVDVRLFIIFHAHEDFIIENEDKTKHLYYNAGLISLTTLLC